MAVAAKILGRDVTFTMGGSAVVGVNSKNWTFNNETIDLTQDTSNGWVTKAAEAGLKSIEFGVSGWTQNLELVNSFFGSSQAFAFVCTYPEGSTLAFDATLESLSHTGESNGQITFEATFASTGAPTWTAGV